MAKEYIEREAVENVIEALAGGFNYIECGWKYAVLSMSGQCSASTTS